jgi:dihydroxyacetone kinase-like protein
MVRSRGEPRSVRAARVVERWLRLAAAEVRARRAWLTDLDAAIGDADHGINLDRGLSAVVADLDAAADGSTPPAAAGALLVAAGRRILGLVGGASGALYGRALIRAGERLDADAWGTDAAVAAFEAALDAVVGLGRARPGDKTLVDALVPALETMRSADSGAPIQRVLRAAADAADAGAAATIPLVARRGRASYLGERSVGHLDPGAASTAILVRCLAHAVAASDPASSPD